MFNTDLTVANNSGPNLVSLLGLLSPNQIRQFYVVSDQCLVVQVQPILPTLVLPTNQTEAGIAAQYTQYFEFQALK